MKKYLFVVFGVATVLSVNAERSYSACEDYLKSQRQAFTPFQLPQFRFLEGPVQDSIDWVEGEQSRATLVRRGVRLLGHLPKFKFDKNPIQKIDFTIGGKLKSYRFHYKDVNYHFSVVLGEDPTEPTLLFNTGLTADSVSMWADIANFMRDQNGFRGSMVFFDPAGVGFSDTQVSVSKHQMHGSSDALVAGLTALDLNGPYVFVVQSYGIFPWMDFTISGRLRESAIVAYGTSPMQMGISAFSPLVRGLTPNGTSLTDLAFKFVPRWFSGPEDGPWLLYLLVGGGMPIQFAAQWGLGLSPEQVHSFYEILRVNIEKYAQWGRDGGKIKGTHWISLLGGDQDLITPAKSIADYGRILASSGPHVSVKTSTLRGGTHVGVDPQWRAEIVEHILEKLGQLRGKPGNYGKFQW